MALRGYDRHDRLEQVRFGEDLNTAVSPAQPIKSPEFLMGPDRERELQNIQRALHAKGRHIFIFGERGVGKTSLAQTAAGTIHHSGSTFIDISCSPDTTLHSLVADIAYTAMGTTRTQMTTTRETFNFGIKFAGYLFGTERTAQDLSEAIKSNADCLQVLREVSDLYAEDPVIVVDEVDRIENAHELDRIADLLKQSGDKELGVKFIFTGVGSTLEEILGAHGSAIRQLETIELPRLSWNGRWEIAENVLSKFGIELNNEEMKIRLAAVSDGFPFYVHLIIEKLLWNLFDAEEEISQITWPHYYNALDRAIQSIHAELARPYALATENRGSEYEEVVWATCADEWQGASVSDMYSTYSRIISQRSGSNLLDRSKFSARIRNLTKISYGGILQRTSKNGYYSYKEKMLRGYIRMQAEAQHVELLTPEAKETVRTFIPRVSSSKLGYHVSKPPKGF